MAKYLFFFFFVSLFSADYKFSSTAHKRHLQQKQILSEEKKQYPYMTGNWGGARSYLAEKGVSFSASFATDTVGNPIGGRARGIAYAGSFGADMHIDFSKFSSLENWIFYVSSVWRTGTSLSSRKIDNQFPVQQVFGSQTVKLNSLYLQKTAFDNSLLLRAGRLNAGDTFLQSPLFYKFVNNAFDGNPISIFFNMPFQAYPNAVWGVYGYAKSTSFQGKIGVYQGNTRVTKNRFHGINFSFSSPEGVVYVAEIAYLLNQDVTSTPWQGNYKLGLIFSDGTKETDFSGKHNNNYTIYLQWDQQLYCEKENPLQGLTAFTSFLYAPPDRNELPYFFISGLIYDGLFPSRTKDSTCLGIAYGSYSEKLRNFQKERVLPPQKFEMIVELNHLFLITKWFEFQPCLQYVVNPKGFESTPNALVIGFQSKIIF